MTRYFRDRLDAAAQLIPFLKKYINKEGIVLAIPRGGVPMGCYIARELNMPLDLLMTKKIGHPNNPEYAIGAVSLEGRLVNELLDIDVEYINTETHRLQEAMKQKYNVLMGDNKPLDVKDKVIIIVDDGIATGFTLMAAIQLLKKKKPHKIVIAVPVAPLESAQKIKRLVDDFICLYTPTSFIGIGAFYDDFSQISDDMAKQYIQQQMIDRPTSK